MSKFSNLYDIDGNIISRPPHHRFTIEETEKLIEELRKKVEDNPDNKVYKVYLANAQKWLMHMYTNMSPADLMKRLREANNSQVEEAKSAASAAEQAQLEEVAKAVEELKKEYDAVETNSNELDEYVEPIEEIAA